MFLDVTPITYLKARRKNKRQGFFSEVSYTDLTNLASNGGRIRLHDSYQAGYLITSTKDLQGLFNNARTGLGSLAVEDAIEQGAVSLDCFDGFLVEYYGRFGFEVTGRDSFNEELAPAEFDIDKYGKPDIVYMALDGRILLHSNNVIEGGANE